MPRAPGFWIKFCPPLAVADSIPQMTTAVFGYGSLIFKPPPYDLSSQAGYIKNYVRRFAQASHDHRGTDEHPGRGALASFGAGEGADVVQW